jgi:uncharacterized membrane protein
MRLKLFSSWDFLALAGFCGLLAYYPRVLPLLPDPVPTHWDAANRINGWTPKDQLHWVVFGLPLGLWLLLLVVGAVTARLTKDPVKAELNAFHPLRGLMGLGVCALSGAILAVPLKGPGVLPWAVAFLVACLFVGVFVLVRQTAQLLKDAPDAGNYRWGVIYHNPADPRLWVEKRIGIGWTLNFARPAAWWMMVLILLPLVLVLGGVLAVVKTGR